ncbi:MAG TPA: CHAD domain-containing protein, partial [Pseudonocardiaceae bacterium]
VRALAAAVSAPLPTAAGDGPRPPLESLVRKEYRRLAKAVSAAGAEPPDAVLHELRILGKRLRYTAELVEPALADAGRRKEVRRLLKATTAMQDVLGDHQDACVAQQRVRELLAGLGDAAGLDVAFAAGRIVEREEVRRLVTRAAWPPAWQAVVAAADDALPAA